MLLGRLVSHCGLQICCVETHWCLERSTFVRVRREDARLNCLMLTGKRDSKTFVVGKIYICEQHLPLFLKQWFNCHVLEIMPKKAVFIELSTPSLSFINLLFCFLLLCFSTWASRPFPSVLHLLLTKRDTYQNCHMVWKRSKIKRCV